ncbi:MAG TPA: cell division protein FtsA, partial [bacterium]|nr:cell division protein FtsA [bacterium]
VPDIRGAMAHMVDSPAYATGVGLVLHGARQRAPGRLVRTVDGAGSVFGRVRQWLREFTQGA